MSKAKLILSKLSELVEGTPVKEAADLKPGDNVVFKKGHEFEGLLGYVVNVNSTNNTVDLKIGKSTRVSVPASDLDKLDAAYSR